MHVPILLHITTDSSFFFFLWTPLSTTQTGLGQPHVNQFQSWGYGVTMILETPPVLLLFSPHLTAAVSRTYLHRVTRMQSLGGLAR